MTFQALVVSVRAVVPSRAGDAAASLFSAVNLAHDAFGIQTVSLA